MASLLGALARLATRRPVAVLLIAVALGAGGAALAAGLTPSAASDTFVERSSASYRATESYYSNFGGEPVQVLVKGNLQRLLLSSDIVRLAGLEGCLSGRLEGGELAREGGADGPCGRLSKMHAVKVVIGPGTFINEAAVEIDGQLEGRQASAKRLAAEAQKTVKAEALRLGKSEAEADRLGAHARKAYLTGFAAEAVSLALRYGLNSMPSITDHNFVSTLVFSNTAKRPGTPKPRFAYLFPSREAALISVRLRPGLSEARRDAAIAAIRAAVSMPQWHLRYGGHYLITGEPVIVSELTSSIAHSMLILLIAVVLLMALTLSLVYRGRPRLLPLAIALLAVALTFGALALSGAQLSVAEVAVLPVLTGLAVDYSIQMHSRAGEAIAAGESDVRAAVVAGVRAGGPAILAAAAASAAAMLVLELSPVPTVRGFGLLLVIGLALALLCALTAGSAAIVLSARLRDRRASRSDAMEGAQRRRSPSLLRPFAAAAPALGRLAASWRGAEELLQDNRVTRLASSIALERAPRAPKATLGVGLLLAALGWGLASQTPVQTDITKLVPQEMRSLRSLATLERLSGVGGEIDLMISGRNVAKPATIEWMSSYQQEILTRFGRGASGGGCGSVRLCAAFSLPDIFQGPGGSSQAKLSKQQVEGLLKTIPPYFSENVITGDRRVASLAFGVKLMPLAAQQRMIEAMRASLHPPEGVHATLVGLPVLAAKADATVASSGRRAVELLVGLAAVALVLLLAFGGDLRRALAPLLPVALASGWSALVLFAMQVPLNPMSVMLGALVIAISTEFSVLLSERHREERIAGHPPRMALARAYRGTGAAVVASGLTAIVGFGVLAFSDIAMLRDFGIVTLVDLAVSLLGVLLILPVALTLAGDRRTRTRIRIRMPLRGVARGRARHGHSA